MECGESAEVVGCGEARSSGVPRRSAVGPVRTICGKDAETVNPTRRATCRVGQGLADGEVRMERLRAQVSNLPGPPSDRQIERDGHHGGGSETQLSRRPV